MNEVKPLKDIINKDKLNVPRVSCGFDLFDDAMKGGFKQGDLVVISGIAGEGKTSLSRTLTYNLCRQGKQTLWFSYEVTVEALHEKFIEMGIEKFYNVYHPEKNETGNLKWIKEKIIESAKKYGTKFVFIDHIDFLTPADNRTSDNEAMSYKRIMTELKSLAITLNVVIIVMAHMKKIDTSKEPDMQDIAYSGGVFQLADYVFMIWREKREFSGKGVQKYAQADGDELATNRTVIKIVKNRETGQLKYLYCEYRNEKFIEYRNEIPVEELFEDKLNI